MRIQYVLCLPIFLGLFISCNNNSSSYLFEYISDKHTQIHFSNDIKINDEINVIDFQYCYNGGGVGIGDFDNNGLPDIVFTGNQVSTKIYLNEGELRFVDVTQIAKVKTEDWITGVSIIDINSDGLDDIYLNVGGADCNGDCSNLLFVNQGLNPNRIPVFREMAKEYGLNDSEYSQQTVFFDYDLDGDLDAYIVRNGNISFDKNSPIPKKYFPSHLADLLLRNESSENFDHPVFVDASNELKGAQKGFGLGVGINDFNNDGLVDIYVANDFITNDLLYLNHKKLESSEVGFQECSVKMLGHQTYNAMGVDIADVNNDSYPDILVLDMLPDNYRRLKTMVGAMNYDKYELSLKNGYSSQYMRNTLQIHNGSNNAEEVRFADISFLAKLSQTDWSWAPLLMDFDLDGDKDIFITNGYGTDITDLDFINYTQQNNAFGTKESRDKKIKELVAQQKSVRLQNFFFKNNGGLNFDEVSTNWSKEKLSLSNGAAYADLDLDGDLDLVVNNINEKAFVLKNNASEKEDFKYLKIKLLGNKQNKEAIGAKVKLWDDGKVQTHFQSVIRGYLSSMDSGAFFGLKDNEIDSIEVFWPNGDRSLKTNIKSNQTIEFSFNEIKPDRIKQSILESLFTQNEEVINYGHQENKYNDYLNQPLLTTKHSNSGPCMVAADIDMLPGDEIFIGGSIGEPGSIWFKNSSNSYYKTQSLDSIYEDTAPAFFDFDGDADLDLYVGSGGSEFKTNDSRYLDRLYENVGKGRFKITIDKLPIINSATSVVKPFDFDKDGDIDLFVGSNITPGKYPLTPESYVLLNENGEFSKIEFNGLSNIGMVKDASWADIDNDGWPDLVLVGDWMPIAIFKNHAGNLEQMQLQIKNEEGVSINSSGWWRSLSQGDFDSDGDLDFIIGNQGLNNFINPTQEYPMYIVNIDYDKNGSIDPLVAGYYDIEAKKKLMPLHFRDDIMKQLVQLKSKYKSYEDFSKAEFNELLEIKDLAQITLVSYVSASSYLENLGGGNFALKQLPIETQVAPVNTILVKDFDKDGNLDVLMAGNDLNSETHFGRYDALTGILLKGNGLGKLEVIPSDKSGFYLPHQTNEIIEFKIDENNTMILAGQNNQKAKVFEWKQTITQ
ncbi:VCBS repeat-containing protein [Croceitalea rosinachiae]|uniref:VCBS repeat-containing protein n=1 Tax=Croceitalea rosinachiae TaxID=3075596 RepID=A0ABU3A6W0_9FLAO|nr:VCBS repeat-containing protein [Croceitalea sp. F388]MDT0605628.1 VCBS repeat-containing protein [Croceitalea sp. F388]